jgi:hypothetical protein
MAVKDAQRPALQRHGPNQSDHAARGRLLIVRIPTGHTCPRKRKWGRPVARAFPSSETTTIRCDGAAPLLLGDLDASSTPVSPRILVLGPALAAFPFPGCGVGGRPVRRSDPDRHAATDLDLADHRRRSNAPPSGSAARLRDRPVRDAIVPGVLDA